MGEVVNLREAMLGKHMPEEVWHPSSGMVTVCRRCETLWPCAVIVRLRERRG